MTKPTIDIIIPSFNGQKLLEKQLPTVIRNSPGINQIIITDDASVDSTQEFLRHRYPEVVCLSNLTNQGFTKSVNLAAAQSSADFIVLLNNDVYPQPDYLKHALPHFDQPKTFAVSFNEPGSSWPHITWEDGKLHYIHGKKSDVPIYSGWPSGGSCIIRRRLWVALGGFNPIYSPGYWEDIDLGWRAWRLGYQIIWEPKAEVLHQHETTFGLLDPAFISLIKQRNELLFTWQNITNPQLVSEHSRFLLTHTLKHPGYLKVIAAALRQLPHLKRLGNTQLDDFQVLNRLNKPVTDK